MIFNVDQYSSLATKIYNRSISEDIFSIVVCILLLHFFIKERQPQEEKPQEPDASLLIQNFCRIHQFTQRETEIFALLLSHQTNQEIADQLFLSLGTVKTHVHNIFIKLEIKNARKL